MLNEKKLKSIIEDLASEVKTQREPRVEYHEYTSGGMGDEANEHDICMYILHDVIHLMPKGPATLYWREAPNYNWEKDFKTGKQSQIVYCSLGWLSV